MASEPIPTRLRQQYDIRDILWNAWGPRGPQDIAPPGALETLWRIHMTTETSEQLHPAGYEEITGMLVLLRQSARGTTATRSRSSETSDTNRSPGSHRKRLDRLREGHLQHHERTSQGHFG